MLALVLTIIVSCCSCCHNVVTTSLSECCCCRRVRTLCYYIANDNEHLSFDKGSEMTVVGQVDHDWLRCRQGNSEGLVYAACVESFTETVTR